MSYYLLLAGVRDDVKKVSLARLLHHKGGLSLKQSKEAVDELLVGKKYLMKFSNKKRIDMLKNEASRLGAESVLFTYESFSKLNSLRTISQGTLVEV